MFKQDIKEQPGLHRILYHSLPIISNIYHVYIKLFRRWGRLSFHPACFWHEHDNVWWPVTHLWPGDYTYEVPFKSDESPHPRHLPYYCATCAQQPSPATPAKFSRACQHVIKAAGWCFHLPPPWHRCTVCSFPLPRWDTLRGLPSPHICIARSNVRTREAQPQPQTTTDPRHAPTHNNNMQ